MLADYALDVYYYSVISWIFHEKKTGRRQIERAKKGLNNNFSFVN